MAQHDTTTTRRRTATARRSPLDAAALNVHTAAWLTGRFMRAARSEARRTVRVWRRSRRRGARPRGRRLTRAERHR